MPLALRLAAAPWILVSLSCCAVGLAAPVRDLPAERKEGFRFRSVLHWWQELKSQRRKARSLQDTTTVSTQFSPGFNTRQSELCSSQSLQNVSNESVTVDDGPDAQTFLLPEDPVPGLCSFCKVPQLEVCRYDTSECYGISQGNSCRIRCKQPYIGASVVATCDKSGSSGGEADLTFELPQCEILLDQSRISCPNPEVRPQGFEQVQTTGEWVCSEGYYGVAVRTCVMETEGDSCMLKAKFEGCPPLTSCRTPDPPEDHQVFDMPRCGYNTDGCDAVEEGSSCAIGCNYPYVGDPVIATCPPNNVDPNQSLQYDLPNCRKICPAPKAEEGYEQDKDGEWHCMDQYAGIAVKNCDVDENCTRSVYLTGCSKLSPCAAPVLDPCKYEWSSCANANFTPGTECEVRCQLPYTGTISKAVCPHNNSDNTSQMDFLVPWCTLECPDPLPMPDGYWAMNPGYRCAPGYTGIAEKSCRTRPGDCEMEVGYSGCEKLVGCKALPPRPAWPADGNRCMLITDECDSPLGLGGQCKVTCRPPYRGVSTLGTCPSRNTNPDRDMDFTSPSCDIPLEHCTSPIPAGYMKTKDGWRCARGYGGTVLTTCTECGRRVLDGCITSVPCTGLQVYDNCRYNVTHCEDGLGAGERCEITCGPAYQGEPTWATCPADNINPIRPMDYKLPKCELYCEDPDPMPEGYEVEYDYTGKKKWSCAEGWIGRANSDCVLLDGCRTELTLSGCKKLQPCLPLEMDAVRFNAEGCQSVPSGGSCTVSCRAPWQGNEAIATCPKNNVIVDQPLILPQDMWLDIHGQVYNAAWPPRCSLRCDTVGQGYEKALGGIWKCTEGFHGKPKPKSCKINPRCSEAVHLEGCAELIPCKVPELDACRHDVSTCFGFQRETACQITCREPYVNVGDPNSGWVYCPINNTETNGGLLGDLPNCTIEECDDPDPIPDGYVADATVPGGWTCAPGYTGKAKKICLAVPTQPVDNPEKQKIFDQYGSYQPQCTTQGRLEGCIITAPCKKFVIQDSCMYHAPNCNAKIVDGKLELASLWAGEKCEVLCKTPYKEQSSFVGCPSTNTEYNSPALWDPPLCELGCPLPGPPPGYEQVFPGNWSTATPTREVGFEVSNETIDPEDQEVIDVGYWKCADGYTGTALRNCTLLPGCESTAEYLGCRKLHSCAPYTTTKCGINVSDCPADGLSYGASCKISCMLGHRGAIVTATCPENNIRPDREASLPDGKPKCERMFPDGYCYDPVPPPPGYVRGGVNGTGNWTCAEGYKGTAVEVCDATEDEPCGVELKLSGCLVLVPCKPPTVDECWYNASGCVDIMGGDSCEIECAFPALGSASTASCPPNNTDPEQELIFNLPSCTIPSCADPDPVPIEYVRDANISSGWKCTTKYAGVVQATCIFDETCTPVVNLEGCDLIQSCVGPASLDLCKYSINVCYDSPIPGMPGGNDGYQTVQPGGSCEISCRGLFVGKPTVGRCPANNTDPWTKLEYDPALLCDCPQDLDPWPDGYNQSDESDETPSDGIVGSSRVDWVCEPGYGGTAQAECTVGDGCRPVVIFSGCGTLKFCRELNFTNLCEIDYTDCNRQLDGGESCQVGCALPAVGNVVNASCPEENIVRDQELMSGTMVSDGISATYLPFELPTCGPPPWCPDPDPLPLGYVRFGTEGGPADDNYECLGGWAPAPRLKRRCSIYNDTRQSESNVTLPCVLKAEFEGCLPIVNCAGVDQRMVDTCRYNVTTCNDTILPGGYCEVSCLEPLYFGNGSKMNATCPSDNTDPAAQIQVPPELICTPVCPEPDPVPAGYIRAGLDWECDENWIGTAVAECKVVAVYSSETREKVCSVEIILSGCQELQNCQPPVLDKCIFDTSDCLDVKSGHNCSLKCRSPPYEGTPTNGSCPAGNLDPLTGVEFTAPNCSLVCPIPAEEDMQDGYNYSNGEWVCLEGWFGTPKAECMTDPEECTFGISLTGCGQSSPCIGLNQSSAAGQCIYDIEPFECSSSWPGFPSPGFGRGAGGSCKVSCRLPCQVKEGEIRVTDLVCPETNVNLKLPLQGTLPQCSFDCDPVDPEGGYYKGADGEWACAPGYAGEVTASCQSGEICNDELVLKGCNPLLPCRLNPSIPVLPCTYITTCAGIGPGESCEVFCNSPYYLGDPRPAYCPADNVNYNGRANIPQLPDCYWNSNETCPDPRRAPQGYVYIKPGDANYDYNGSDDPTKESGYWTCAPGYAGSAVRNCGLRTRSKTSAECIAEAVLTGCAQLERCVEPQTGNWKLDCRFNTSATDSLSAGASDFITCNVPYAGEPRLAQCPDDNNAPGQEPIYEWPDCQPACPPVPGEVVPEGYHWDSENLEWRCADGYKGPAEVNCTISLLCEWQLSFGNCFLLQPCEDLNLTVCEINQTDCQDMGEGDTCTLSCQAPSFVGNTTTAFCPKGNIIEGRSLIYTLPVCNVTCIDPVPPPVGYTKASAVFGDWMCAAGFSGVAHKSCVTSSWEEGCITRTVLDGCLPIVPCKNPDWRTTPPCIYDTSLCEDVFADDTCNVTCMYPYSGTMGYGYCAVNNTDAFRPLVYTWPQCSLNLCPDPDLGTLPVGYDKIPGQVGNAGWKCADMFVGTPELSCIASNPRMQSDGTWDCSVASTISGCTGEVPCARLPLDGCILDLGNCSEQVQVDTTCEISCKWPYVGSNGSLSCPAANTDPWLLPDLTSPHCDIDCSHLYHTVPAGHRRKANGKGWECVEGYAGSISETCYLNYQSNPCGDPVLQVYGCYPLADCVAPMVDLCQYHVHDCQLIERGENCTIDCRLPYTGSSTVASCPLDNTDTLEGLERNLPKCDFWDCPDPAEMPLGFVSHGLGNYSCDMGYIGSVVRRCSAFAIQGSRIGNAAVGPECYPEAVFSGCRIEKTIVPCRPPALSFADRCLYNISTCSEASALEPGGRCEMSCQQPYWKGIATQVVCPIDNTDANGGMEWESPQCNYWCPEPTPEEEPAYVRDAAYSSQGSTGWTCQEGYVGSPIVTCELIEGGRRTCSVAKLRMSGCTRTEVCAPLTIAATGLRVKLPTFGVRGQYDELPGEGFEMDIASCSELGPGQSCIVFCRYPFFGKVVVGHCPAGNTDRHQMPILPESPFCELRCTDPEITPTGYELIEPEGPPRLGAEGEGGTEWVCASGYTGRPLKSCNASAACNATAHDGEGECANAVELEIELTGCTKLQSCALPVVNPCQMEDFACPSSGFLFPGESCNITCRAPFRGPPTTASCPPDNILLNGEGLVFPTSQCAVPECYDPVPPGYMLGKDGWECADGFHGRPVEGCRTDENCLEELRLTGCVQLQPCVPPQSADRCRWNFDACANTLDGETCEFTCLGPLYTSTGAVGIAQCPKSNTNPEQELQVLSEPLCEPVCQHTRTPGYDGNIRKGFTCSEGWHGVPVETCVVVEVQGMCQANFSLAGCDELMPCTVPEEDEFCMYDLRGCENLPANGSCNITCKAGYVGDAGHARCPFDNIVAGSLPVASLPDCQVEDPCADPAPFPEGYEYSIDNSVVCAAGYFGQALRQCVAVPVPGSNLSLPKGNCTAEAMFTGCEKILPCLRPPISSTDCELEISNCSATLEPGESCWVSCTTPLSGEPTEVRCSETNTIPDKVADWTPPICGCPDPPMAPAGFKKAFNWECLAGYVGRAKKQCLCRQPFPLLSGCHAPVVCGAAGFTDDDTRKGFMAGKLKFGPSSLGEDIDEAGVWKYQAFWADDCGSQLPDMEVIAEATPVTVGGPTNLFDSRCCKGDFYQINVPPQEPPEGAKNILLRVTTRSGDSPEGLIVPLEDFNYESPGDGNRVSYGSDAQRQPLPRLLMITALLVVAAR